MFEFLFSSVMFFVLMQASVSAQVKLRSLRLLMTLQGSKLGFARKDK
jgi:hypothetical protein